MTYTNCSDLERVFLLNKCKAFILQLKVIISLKSSKLRGLQNTFETPEQPLTCCVWYCLLPDADKKPDNVQPSNLHHILPLQIQLSCRFVFNWLKPSTSSKRSDLSDSALIPTGQSPSLSYCNYTVISFSIMHNLFKNTHNVPLLPIMNRKLNINKKIGQNQSIKSQ